MKLAVATQRGGLDDMVLPIFGRAPTFTMVNVEDEEIKGANVIQNQYASAPGGAGIQAAGLVANQGAKAVIAGNFGPNVVGVLNQSRVEMIQVLGMKVRDAVRKYLDGELIPTSQATTPPGRGMGAGRGMGMGRGMGRGMMQQPMQPPQQPPQQPISKEQELQMLKNRASMIEDQLEQIRKRIEEIKKRK